MRSPHLALLLAAITAAAGCTAPQPGPRVASLETGQAGSPSSSGASPAQAARPRYRLDMTPEEGDRLAKAYDRCLDDHLGIAPPPAGSTSGTDLAAAPMNPELQRRYEEAEAAGVCLAKKPLPTWEYDTANPEALDFAQKVVRCVRDKGVRFVEVKPVVPGDDQVLISLGGPQNDSASIKDGLTLIPECEKQLASGGGR